MNEIIYAIWLSEALGTGSIFAKTLISEYGSFEAIYKLNQKDYENAGIKANTFAMSKLCRKNTDSAEKCASFCESNNFNIISYKSNAYPERLRAISNPPAVLYVRGRMIDFDDNVCIGVVGTRSYSDAGWNATYKIASGLASGGAVVVTGLAGGIDTAAAKAALASSGFAVGVLGTGLEKIYPSENKELFEEMYQKGLVISERPPFSEITGKYFPVRNRIISGLCNGVLIGEGSVKSGAMITAAHASEQGRTVFAIPGDISGEESSGVNGLIRDGAYPVFAPEDILSKYEYFYPHRIGKALSTDGIIVPEERSKKRIRVLRGSQKAVSEEKVQPEKPKEYATSENVMPMASESVTKKVKTEKTVNTKVGAEQDTPYNPYPNTKECTDEKKNAVEADDSFGETEKKIYKFILSKGSVTTDAICNSLNESPMNVNISLTLLEMGGYVVTKGPNVSIK